jgi:hypothetical protein
MPTPFAIRVPDARGTRGERCHGDRCLRFRARAFPLHGDSPLASAGELREPGELLAAAVEMFAMASRLAQPRPRFSEQQRDASVARRLRSVLQTRSQGLTLTMRVLLSTVLLVTSAFACAPEALPLPAGIDAARYADLSTTGESGAPRFNRSLCEGVDLSPDRAKLTEANFVRFIQAQRFEVRVERQQVDEKNRELLYVFVRIPGVAEAIPLRVAVLPSSEAAGRSLYEAVLERGAGAWGVHRGNLAVLGPMGSLSDDVAFAGLTKMACWGVFTFAGTDDAFVAEGGYVEP